MGKVWDRNLNHGAWATEALRVLKPGAHLLAFGGTRTFHRLTCALEDAGFEIRDCLSWLYGSGFPKSLDVSKAIDKAAGAEREVVGRVAGMGKQNPEWNGTAQGRAANSFKPEYDATIPATEAAQRWQGWGTALKPAWEPIILARKPLAGNVASNVQAYGTGALNIDGTRIEGKWTTWRRGDGSINPDAGFADEYVNGSERPQDVRNPEHPAGRWPANVVLDPEAAALLDEQTGELPAGVATKRNLPDEGARQNVNLKARTQRGEDVGYGDRGGASRFFFVAESDSHEATLPTDAQGSDGDRGAGNNAATSLPEVSGLERGGSFSAASMRGTPADLTRFRYVPKADREERERGLEHFPRRKLTDDGYGSIQEPILDRATPRENWTPHRAANHHPTVKPVELMRWLCGLITPPGGTVLDPFAGSGSTGIAALREGFSFIGIEREAEYVEIARARIQGDAPLFNVASEVTA
jgi:site-specific DNA-methyltransferase (adenine-specific)